MNKVLFILLILMLILTACSREPQPITFGQDACAHCRMIISDQNFGAESITAKGKVYKFDSIECMAAFEIQQGPEKSQGMSHWVVAFNNAGKLSPLQQTRILHSVKLRSPMGLNLSAHLKSGNMLKTQEKFEGNILVWTAVKHLVRESWFK